MAKPNRVGPHRTRLHSTNPRSTTAPRSNRVPHSPVRQHSSRANSNITIDHQTMSLIIHPTMQHMPQVTLHSIGRRIIPHRLHSSHHTKSNHAVAITLSLTQRLCQGQRHQHIGHIRHLNSMVIQAIRSSIRTAAQANQPIRTRLPLRVIRHPRNNSTRHVQCTPFISFNIAHLACHMDNTPQARLISSSFTPILNRRFKVNSANQRLHNNRIA